MRFWGCGCGEVGVGIRWEVGRFWEGRFGEDEGERERGRESKSCGVGMEWKLCEFR